ncbi:hypothetical protein Q9R32_12250 [Actinotalea sp. AC32]|nr:hypothetical protein [Actinotalea sp. AC32]
MTYSGWSHRPGAGGLKQRLRLVAAGWVVVGFAGAGMAALVAVLVLVGLGPFGPQSRVDVEREVPWGEEVETTGVSPGSLVVLAYPASVDVAEVSCSWTSRVYSTGEQRSGELEVGRPDGAAATMRSRDGREWVPVAVTGRRWMEADHVSCTGGGAATTGLADDELLTSRFRLGVGVVLTVVAPVLAGLGALALSFTRRWNREAAEQDAAMRAHGLVPQAWPPGTWGPPRQPGPQGRPGPPHAHGPQAPPHAQGPQGPPAPPHPPGRDPYAPPHER